MEQQILSFPVILALSATLVVLTILKQLKNKSNPPPGPWRIPLVGNFHQLVGGLPHHRLSQLAKIYGPVMGIQLGEIPILVLSSVETAKEVLKTQDEVFAGRPLFLSAKILLYNRKDIIFGSHGDDWRLLRKLCTLELLSAKRVQQFKSVREEELSSFVKFLRSKAGTPVNLTLDLFALSINLVVKISIGKKCKNQEALLSTVDHIIEMAGGFNFVDAFPSLTFLHNMSNMKARMEKLHQKVDHILEDIINEHRAARNNSDHHRGEANNLLDVLLDLQENGSLEVPLTDDSIKGTILDMFGAGSDTSSRTAEWTLSELMRHPQEMKRAQEEIRRVFGENGNIDEARFHELKFLKLVMKETFRLHPPVALIPRECRKRTKVNGYDIYPQTRTLINIWSMGRDPSIWTEAEKFYPDRFLDSQIDYRGSNFELLPFGAGKRICPGITLGTINLELFLVHALYHFDWKMVDGVSPDTLDMSEAFGGAIKRKTDLKLIPIPVGPIGS